MEKTDFKRLHKALYQPKQVGFEVVEVPELHFLTIQGQGAPEGPAYAAAVQWLYSTVYPAKFAAKKTLQKDFIVAPLEGLWWADDLSDFATGHRDNWKWQMMIALPDWLPQDLINAAMQKASGKLGDIPESLQRQVFHEGLCVQTLFIGPYADEAPVIAELHNSFLPENGLVETGHHHEIYLNDPRRTAPEKLKTILRQPVRKA